MQSLSTAMAHRPPVGPAVHRPVGRSRASSLLLVAIACVGCTQNCPAEREPPRWTDECGDECELNLTVATTSEMLERDAFRCDGFAPLGAYARPACSGLSELSVPMPIRGSSAGDRLFGYVGPLPFEGYPLVLETEDYEGGRGRICFFYQWELRMTAPNGCTYDWECAVEGTVTMGPGDLAAVHAVFAGGGTIDATIPVERW